MFQALCAACHREKTDQQGNPARTLVSRTSPRVWREYVETKRPPPLVWSPHAHTETAKLVELDVCRCRKSALAHCAYDIPVICPYDNIAPARPGHLADFSFVQLSGRGRRSTLSLLPYVGRMWYHRAAVEHMLHHGIATWGDITWSLNATGHLPPSTLEGPLEAIDRAWGSDRHLAKLSINSMIGLWAATRTHAYSVSTSSNTSDVTQSMLTRHFAYGEQHVIDSIQVSRLLDNSTMRPIHDLIMHNEHTRMAQLAYVLARLGSRHVPSNMSRRTRLFSRFH